MGSVASSEDSIVSAQTSTSIGAGTGTKTIAAAESQCLLRVKGVDSGVSAACPVRGQIRLFLLASRR